MRAAVAAAWVTGLLGLGAAGTSGAVGTQRSRERTSCQLRRPLEKVSELGATNPALLHLYAKAHGKGLPRLERERAGNRRVRRH